MSILDRFKKPKKDKGTTTPTPTSPPEYIHPVPHDIPTPEGPGEEGNSDVCIEANITMETVESLLERGKATPVSEIAGEEEEV